MSGTQLRILSKTEYDMSTVLGQTGASPGAIILAKNVDVSQWREATLMVRLHTATWSNGASLSVVAYPSLPTEEDPGTDYTTNNPVATVTFTQGASGESAPKLKLDDLTAGFGPFLTIALGITQGQTASAQLKFTISVELSLKS